MRACALCIPFGLRFETSGDFGRTLSRTATAFFSDASSLRAGHSLKPFAAARPLAKPAAGATALKDAQPIAEPLCMGS
jgi:hypothetical protein